MSATRRGRFVWEETRVWGGPAVSLQELSEASHVRLVFREVSVPQRPALAQLAAPDQLPDGGAAAFPFSRGIV